MTLNMLTFQLRLNYKPAVGVIYLMFNEMAVGGKRRSYARLGCPKTSDLIRSQRVLMMFLDQGLRVFHDISPIRTYRQVLV